MGLPGSTLTVYRTISSVRNGTSSNCDTWKNFRKGYVDLTVAFEDVLPATAGATAWLLGAFCSSVVGSGFCELPPEGVRGPLPSLKSLQLDSDQPSFFFSLSNTIRYPVIKFSAEIVINKIMDN